MISASYGRFRASAILYNNYIQVSSLLTKAGSASLSIYALALYMSQQVCVSAVISHLL